MADIKAKNWKHGKYVPMLQVMCKGALTWANPTKMGMYRCTGCGQEHR